MHKVYCKTLFILLLSDHISGQLNACNQLHPAVVCLAFSTGPNLLLVFCDPSIAASKNCLFGIFKSITMSTSWHLACILFRRLLQDKYYYYYYYCHYNYYYYSSYYYYPAGQSWISAKWGKQKDCRGSTVGIFRHLETA